MRKMIYLLAVFSLVLSAHCQTADEYLNQGISRLNNKDYSGAIQVFSQAISINPGLIEAYNKRGNGRQPGSNA
jgi:Flp pilus assembly protein TadD